MQTIIVLLNPGMLENADLDLRYRIPDRIEEVSNSLIQSNGYDYIDTEDGDPGPLMGIWLETENAHRNWHIVRDLFQREKFIGNDLSLSAQIYISEKDTDEVINHHFKWWFNISPPKGYYYCSPRRAVSQALLLAPL